MYKMTVTYETIQNVVDHLNNLKFSTSRHSYNSPIYCLATLLHLCPQSFTLTAYRESTFPWRALRINQNCCIYRFWQDSYESLELCYNLDMWGNPRGRKLMENTRNRAGVEFPSTIRHARVQAHVLVGT